MKTFAVRLRYDMEIDGVKFEAGAHVGAMTSEVNPANLLGLIQFNHAEVEEITDAEDADDILDDATDATDATDETSPSPPGGPDSEGALTPEPSPPPVSPEGEADSQPPMDPQEVLAASVAAFVADGLDEKTAVALVEANSIGSPAELLEFLADESFVLTELEDIGEVRAKKILAIYQPQKTA